MTRPQGSKDGPDTRAFEAASEWFVRSKAGLSAVERAEFNVWLASDSDHAEALKQTIATWDEMAGIASAPELDALRRQALENSASATGRKGTSSLMRLAAGLACAVVLAGLGGALVLGEKAPASRTFATKAGQRSTVTLEDGSRLSLDEGTTISVRYARKARDLELLMGQAEFQVAKDASRPFSVTAAGRRVVATGTVFGVDLLASNLIVSLVEGHVFVAPSDGGERSPKTVHLEPKDRLEISTASGAVRMTKVDAVDMEAWKEGKLIFDAEPLDRAVSRVNRYARRKITLEDKSVASRQISGVFNAGDADAFARGVSAQLPLRADFQTADIRLVSRTKTQQAH